MRRQKILLFLMTLFLAVLFFQFFHREKIVAPENKTAAKKTAPLKKPVRSARLSEASVSETNSTAQKVVATNELGEELIDLSREQVEAYLTKTRRCAECLLNAFEETGNHSYFREALEKFPDNPRVQLALLTDGRLKDEWPAEDRKIWLERFKSSLPNNAFPNYLAAIDDFKNGQTDSALSELNSALQKGTVDPLYRERIQGGQEVLLLSGFSPEEAAAAQSISGTTLPSESEMKNLSMSLAELEKNYISSGDNASAQKIAAMGIDMARRWGDEKSSPFIISKLVGIAMERKILNELNPDTAYDFLSGGTPQQRLQELNHQRAEISEFTKSFEQNYPPLDARNKLIYWNRTQIQGELNALKWLHQNYGT
ncbi:MAG: hypothetical protein M3Y82_06505, partial [Verrucomicrobiota bacterium]|nr:hypothetical protein [Verrucomicrobiota bacterium]